MRNLLFLALLACSGVATAQLNAELLANLTYDDGVNDIWGYAAPDGTEYAIVGLENGVSFVSLADPENPVELHRIAGTNSPWRDMKTFGEYAYSVADVGSEGLTAFDLRFLPDSLPFQRTTYQVPGVASTFGRAHNIYIDEPTGIAFTAGGSRNIIDGGILMFDLNADPMSPPLVGVGPAVYSHDVYVKGDTMYCSEINQGNLTLYGIADFDNITLIGRTKTPFEFTHNAWTTDDAQNIFTTDELANAPVGSYDISDPSDIRLLDEYRPLGSIGNGVIPHNVHVIDDYLSISYYTDGLRVVDASKPDNLIEVANWDTWPGADGDFNGAWGATPFLPSGLTLVSDRQTGLYVIDVNYVRAARLEGIITDELLGTPINDVQVSITAPQENEGSTDALGRYRTGLASAGTYTVTFTAENYDPLTVEVDLLNDVCVVLDTTMTTSIPRFPISVTVIDDETEEVIPGASFVLYDDAREDVSRRTDADGKVFLQAVFDGTYDLYVAEWGYQTQSITETSPSALGDVTIRLRRGYMDDFVTNEGWELTEQASTGNWERVFPLGTFLGDTPFAPGSDVEDDFGGLAYITGQGISGGSSGSNDVDGGTTLLVSPPFKNIGPQDSLVVNYQYWFANGGGDTDADDAMRIYISNGIDTVLVREYLEDGVREWRSDSFRVVDFVEETAELRLLVETFDLGNGHLVEAGFDNFFVTARDWPVGTDNTLVEGVTATVYPNPTANEFTLQFELDGLPDPSVRITDALGRRVSGQRITSGTGALTFGNDLPQGFYFVEIFTGAQRAYVTKVVKQ